MPGAPVVDTAGRYLGTVHAGGLAGETPVGRLVDATAPTVTDRASLDEAVDALPAGQPWQPVLDQERRVVGSIAVTDVVRGYRGAVAADAKQLAAVASNAATFDAVVANDSAMIGRPLRDIPLPDGTIVLTISRGDDLLAPSADLKLAAGGDSAARPTTAARAG